MVIIIAVRMLIELFVQLIITGKKINHPNPTYQKYLHPYTTQIQIVGLKMLSSHFVVGGRRKKKKEKINR